jgi:hypothetical protein
MEEKSNASIICVGYESSHHNLTVVKFLYWGKRPNETKGVSGANGGVADTCTFLELILVTALAGQSLQRASSPPSSTNLRHEKLIRHLRLDL